MNPRKEGQPIQGQPIPLNELVAQAKSRAIRRYAETIGQQFDEATRTYHLVEESLYTDPRAEMALLQEEIRVIPLIEQLRRSIPNGELQLVPEELLGFARNFGVHMHLDNLILAMGRVSQKMAKREALVEGFDEVNQSVPDRLPEDLLESGKSVTDQGFAVALGRQGPGMFGGHGGGG